ncbi:MAG: AAA family ATPase [Chloroflexota bacterium]
MSSLILDSLEIRNFRVFRHLCIERLGRVNLIVGKNSVGKTCLLEAVWLFARKAEPRAVWEQLVTRDEMNERFVSDEVEMIRNQLAALKYLSHGRRNIPSMQEPIQIGPAKVLDRRLSIQVGLHVRKNGKPHLELQTPLSGSVSTGEAIPVLAIQVGEKALYDYPLDKPMDRTWTNGSDPVGVRCVLISANGLESRQVSELWDKVALTDLEESVLDSLRLIAPEVKRVNLISGHRGGRERVPIARLEGLEEPVSLRSLGEGMTRVLGVALALVNAREGLLLIDEVESGLHYSVQLGLWRSIFALAHRLNVQVFATTHSWDCVTAFQQATQEDQQEEGMLIRLENRRGEIVPVLIDEKQLAIATSQEIEIR